MCGSPHMKVQKPGQSLDLKVLHAHGRAKEGDAHLHASASDGRCEHLSAAR